jgi:hypothetical protein
MRKMNRRSYLRSSLFITGGLALPSLSIAESLAESERIINSGSQNLDSGIDGDRINPLPDLKDLSTGWIRRYPTQLAAMPGLNNDIGSIQMEADPVAVKHPVFPPYSGGNEISGISIINGKNIAQVSDGVEIRWTAYGTERRCTTDGWELTSLTSLLPDEAGYVMSLSVLNSKQEARSLSFGLLLSGRAMNTGNEGYAWAVPSIPTDVSSFLKTEGLRQDVVDTDIENTCLIKNEGGNAYAANTFNIAPTLWKEKRNPVWNIKIGAGKSWNLNMLVTYAAEQEVCETMCRKWRAQISKIAPLTRQKWEELWKAAFTQGNNIFSGSLPAIKTDYPSLDRIYYNGILTLLTCRRKYPHAKIKPCYITLWPRRGEGSAYLAWDLPFISGILSRLDPKALLETLLAAMSAPELDFQVTNFFTLEHGGWACCSNPMAIYISAFHLLRNSADRSWLDQMIIRVGRSTRGFEAASQGQVTDEKHGSSVSLTARQALEEAVFIHRRKKIENEDLVDFGTRSSYLECITTYAHGTAGHTAQQIWAMKQYDELFGGDTSSERQKLMDAIMHLYRNSEGHFDCLYPDGRKFPAANLYDTGLVLTGIGDILKPDTVKEIISFVRNQLITPTWARCLASTDLDALSGNRCDHQWAGSFPSWISQFVSGIYKSRLTESDVPWLMNWLEGVSKTVLQGPFAQAYWAEDVYPAELGAAAKCYDELVQGNHWAISSGVHLSEMVLILNKIS